MTHITQETAVALAKQAGASGTTLLMMKDSELHALCEATAKHVIDTLTAGVELPPLPGCDTFTGRETEDYALQAVASALAKQAGEIERLKVNAAASVNEYAQLEQERDLLRVEVDETHKSYERAYKRGLGYRADRDQLKARLAALEPDYEQSESYLRAQPAQQDVKDAL